LQAPFDLCPCTGCRRVIGEGGQCKVCKHPYCMSCDMIYSATVRLCDQDFLCGRTACLGGGHSFHDLRLLRPDVLRRVFPER
jgi:hypothetical protein